MATSKKATASWDDPENEAVNTFVSWGQVGDFIFGTFIGVREVKSRLPDHAGEIQKIYDFKVKECSYHVLDDKKRVVEEAIVPNEGDIVSVGGRASIDSRMARIARGQKVGLKFDSEIPSTTKGYNPTKSIKVYDKVGGVVVMDEEWLESQKDELDAFSGKNEQK